MDVCGQMEANFSRWVLESPAAMWQPVHGHVGAVGACLPADRSDHRNLAEGGEKHAGGTLGGNTSN